MLSLSIAVGGLAALCLAGTANAEQQGHGVRRGNTHIKRMDSGHKFEKRDSTLVKRDYTWV